MQPGSFESLAKLYSCTSQSLLVPQNACHGLGTTRNCQPVLLLDIAADVLYAVYMSSVYPLGLAVMMPPER